MGILLLLALTPLAAAQINLRVLPNPEEGAHPKDLHPRWLRSEAARHFEAWQGKWADLTTRKDIEARQTQLRLKLRDSLGGFFERTPLNARTVGTIDRAEHRVEKVILESHPGFHVTAALFLPDPKKWSPPFPAVLVPCGHSREGKAADAYQRACILAARNGIAALIFDPVDQGERIQLLRPGGGIHMWGTQGHTHAGVGCILLGRNTATYEIWDGMRCLDWLCAREDIDGSRIGCMGNSGGGTQTAYLMALDDRIKAASPSCYITNLYERILELGPQDAEQNIFGQLAWHMDHADYLVMRAPTPVLVCAARRDFFDIRGTRDSVAAAQRVFGRLGHQGHIALAEVDAAHGWHRGLREAAVGWMARWLQGRNEPIEEPDRLPVLTEQEMRCTPEGQVRQLPESRSIYDLNRELLRVEEARRAPLWTQLDPPGRREHVRQICGIRSLESLPYPRIETKKLSREEETSLEQYVLWREDGVPLPVVVATPPNIGLDPPVLLLDIEGKTAAWKRAQKYLEAGRIVALVDVRGSGETRQTGQRYHRGQGNDGIDVYLAYLLGKSLLGLRVEDVLVAARWLREQYGSSEGSVDVDARGAIGVPALHAVFVEPGLFRQARIEECLEAWSDVVRSDHNQDQLQNAVHGALRVYDLPDLADALGPRLTRLRPADASGRAR